MTNETPEILNGKFVFPKFLYAQTTDNKTIDVSYAPQSLDAIEYIRSDSLQREQPEVDFETEYAKFSNDTDAQYPFPIDLSDYREFALHFYELGKHNARKEE